MKTSKYLTMVKDGINYHIIDMPGTDIFRLEVLQNVGSNLEKYFKRYYGTPVYGVSHLIEHLSFKSPEGYSSLEIMDLYRKYGRHNASTGNDKINYHMISTMENIDLVTDIVIKTAYNDLTGIDLVEFDKEKDVVINEINRYYENKQTVYNFKIKSRYYGLREVDTTLGSTDMVKNVSLEDVITMKSIMINNAKQDIIIACDMDDVSILDYVNKLHKTVLDAINNTVDNDRTITAKMIETDPERVHVGEYIYPDECGQELTTIIIPIKNMNHTAQALICDYINKKSGEHSLFHNIRTLHGLTYGTSFYVNRYGNDLVVTFQVDVSPGNRDKAIALFNDVILNIIDTYTIDVHNDYIRQIKLDDKLDKLDRMDYVSLIKTIINIPSIKYNLDTRSFNDLSKLYTDIIDASCTYDDMILAIKNVSKAVASDMVIKIRN